MTNIDPDLHQSLQEYRDRMEWPIENLTIAIWGRNQPENFSFKHDDIVEVATRKINMLRKMLLASGFNPDMLNAVMEE